MPKERSTYVTTASVYVDDVYSPEEATSVISLLNSMISQQSSSALTAVQIRLPDEQQWEKVS